MTLGVETAAHMGCVTTRVGSVCVIEVSRVLCANCIVQMASTATSARRGQSRIVIKDDLALIYNVSHIFVFIIKSFKIP